MTDAVDTANTIILAGRAIRFIPPTQGQFEAMIRISRTLRAHEDEDDTSFWVKQIGRMGDLLEQMIAEGDREVVDDLYIKGKIDHTALLAAILGKVRDNAEESENKAISKASKTRVQRK